MPSRSVSGEASALRGSYVAPLFQILRRPVGRLAPILCRPQVQASLPPPQSLSGRTWAPVSEPRNGPWRRRPIPRPRVPRPGRVGARACRDPAQVRPSATVIEGHERGPSPGLATVCEPGPSRARPATARSGAVIRARTVAPASTATLPWGMEHERRSRSDRVCLGSNLGTQRARSGVAAARTPGTEGARASRPRPRSQGQDVGPGWACHGCPVRGAGRGPRGDSQATASREAGGAPSSWQALQAPGAGGGGGGGRGVSRR